MLKTCFIFLLTRLSPAYKKNFTQTRNPPPKKNLTQLKFIFIMVWLLLKTGKNIMANRIPNVPSCFVLVFFLNLKMGEKKEIVSMLATKMGGDQVYKPVPKGL